MQKRHGNAGGVQYRHGNASVASQAHKKGRRPKAPALCPLDVSQRQPPRYACLTRSSFARSAALPLMDTLPVSST